MADPQRQYILGSIDNLRNIGPTTDAQYQFIFDDLTSSSSGFVVFGRVLPDAQSPIYGQGAIDIRIRISPTYPFEVPTVFFKTKVFHPNVGPEEEMGQLCMSFLQAPDTYKDDMALVELIKYIIILLDQPECDYPMNTDAAIMYVDNRNEYNRIAKEIFEQNADDRV